MSMVPIVSSADELDAAIRHAQLNPNTRWYVADRARALGAADRIPADWAVTASAEPDDDALTAGVFRRGEHEAGALHHAAGAFNEALHPRGRDGTFITKGGRVQVIGGSGKAEIEGTVQKVGADATGKVHVTVKADDGRVFDAPAHSIEAAPEARAHLGGTPSTHPDTPAEHPADKTTLRGNEAVRLNNDGSTTPVPSRPATPEAKPEAPAGNPRLGTARVVQSAHYENHGETQHSDGTATQHHKYYESSVVAHPDGTASHVTMWGSTGAKKPSVKVDSHPDVASAKDAHNKKLSEKHAKGYYHEDTAYSPDAHKAAAEAAYADRAPAASTNPNTAPEPAHLRRADAPTEPAAQQRLAPAAKSADHRVAPAVEVKPGDHVIRVRNEAQRILMEDELKGQLSDGHWENAKHGRDSRTGEPGEGWRDWTDAKVVVDPSNPGINFRPSKDNYNLNDSRLMDAVGDRMVANVQDKHNADYTHGQMLKDLADLKKVFKTRSKSDEPTPHPNDKHAATLGVDTLNSRGRDHLDFPNVSNAGLSKALQDAHRDAGGPGLTQEHLDAIGAEHFGHDLQTHNSDSMDVHSENVGAINRAIDSAKAHPGKPAYSPEDQARAAMDARYAEAKEKANAASDKAWESGDPADHHAAAAAHEEAHQLNPTAKVGGDAGNMTHDQVASEHIDEADGERGFNERGLAATDPTASPKDRLNALEEDWNSEHPSVEDHGSGFLNVARDAHASGDHETRDKAVGLAHEYADEIDSDHLHRDATDLQESYGTADRNGGRDHPDLTSDWQQGDPDPATDREYAKAMLSEGRGYQAFNIEEGAQDDRLDAIHTHLENELLAGRDKSAADDADMLRSMLLSDYADEDELPSRPASGSGPGEPDGSVPPAGTPEERTQQQVDDATDELAINHEAIFNDEQKYEMALDRINELAHDDPTRSGASLANDAADYVHNLPADEVTDTNTHQLHGVGSSAVNKGVLDRQTAQSRINAILRETDHAKAHKDLAALMSQAKLGGKQRARYREVLNEHHGNAGSARPAASLSDGNELRDRLAAKEDASRSGKLARANAASDAAHAASERADNGPHTGAEGQRLQREARLAHEEAARVHGAVGEGESDDTAAQHRTQAANHRSTEDYIGRAPVEPAKADRYQHRVAPGGFGLEDHMVVDTHDNNARVGPRYGSKSAAMRDVNKFNSGAAQPSDPYPISRYDEAAGRTVPIDPGGFGDPGVRLTDLEGIAQSYSSAELNAAIKRYPAGTSAGNVARAEKLRRESAAAPAPVANASEEINKAARAMSSARSRLDKLQRSPRTHMTESSIKKAREDLANATSRHATLSQQRMASTDFGKLGDAVAERGSHPDVKLVAGTDRTNQDVMVHGTRFGTVQRSAGQSGYSAFDDAGHALPGGTHRTKQDAVAAILHDRHGRIQDEEARNLRQAPPAEATRATTPAAQEARAVPSTHPATAPQWETVPGREKHASPASQADVNGHRVIVDSLDGGQTYRYQILQDGAPAYIAGPSSYDLPQSNGRNQGGVFYSQKEAQAAAALKANQTPKFDHDAHDRGLSDQDLAWERGGTTGDRRARAEVEYVRRQKAAGKPVNVDEFKSGPGVRAAMEHNQSLAAPAASGLESRFPVGTKVSTTVYSAGDRSEEVTGTVVGHSRGHVVVSTDAHGTLSVEPSKAWPAARPNANATPSDHPAQALSRELEAAPYHPLQHRSQVDLKSIARGDQWPGGVKPARANDPTMSIEEAAPLAQERLQQLEEHKSRIKEAVSGWSDEELKSASAMSNDRRIDRAAQAELARRQKSAAPAARTLAGPDGNNRVAPVPVQDAATPAGLRAKDATDKANRTGRSEDHAAAAKAHEAAASGATGQAITDHYRAAQDHGIAAARARRQESAAPAAPTLRSVPEPAPAPAAPNANATAGDVNGVVDHTKLTTRDHVAIANEAAKSQKGKNAVTTYLAEQKKAARGDGSPETLARARDRMAEAGVDVAEVDRLARGRAGKA